MPISGTDGASLESVTATCTTQSSARHKWVLCRYRHNTHSTGSQKSFARESIIEAASFGSQTYSAEELIAEMGAAYLCAESGISNAVIENQASYVAGWLKKLRDDRKLLIHAATQAQRAADYILRRPHLA